jgi:hypothetical protein
MAKSLPQAPVTLVLGRETLYQFYRGGQCPKHLEVEEKELHMPGIKIWVVQPIVQSLY